MALNHRATESKKKENKNDLFPWVPFYHVSCGYSLTAKSAHQVLRLKGKKMENTKWARCMSSWFQKESKDLFISLWSEWGREQKERKKKPGTQISFCNSYLAVRRKDRAWKAPGGREGRPRGWPVPGWVVTSLVCPFPFLLLKGSTAGRTSPFPSCLDSVRLEIGGLFPQLLTVVTEFWI